MNHPRPNTPHRPFALLVALLLPLAACGGNDDDPTGPNGNGNGNGNGTEASTVLGTVSHGGAGVGAVQVVLRDGPGADRETTTENNGTFSFADVEVGDWEIAFTPPDYFELADGQQGVSAVTVPEGSDATVNLELSPVEAPESIEIGMGESAFLDDDVTVLPGSTVTWVNEAAMVHTITPDGHAEWNSGAVSNAGDTFEVVLNNPGDWEYYCEPHLAQGMTAVVRVEP
jgi:plastocyanin